jgi:hypothetical protein
MQPTNGTSYAHCSPVAFPITSLEGPSHHPWFTIQPDFPHRSSRDRLAGRAKAVIRQVVLCGICL